jgi:hypothetical protein
VKIFENNSKYGLWIKINKDVLNSDKHMYIGGVYLPPSDSNYATKLPFESMEKDFCDLINDGNLIVLGDLNARCGNLADHLKSYNGDAKVGLDILSNKLESHERFNCDTIINSYGRKLVQLCTKTNMAIMNGRIEGDTPGRFTCHKSSGSSVVDYGLISPSIIDQVAYFQVQPPNLWSDHSLINMCIKIQWCNSNATDRVAHKLTPLNDVYQWSNLSSQDYKKAIAMKQISSEVKTLLEKSYDLTDNGSDKICEDITCIYKKAADLCLKKRKLYRKKHKSKFSENFNFILLKKNIKVLGNLMVKYPKDPFIRNSFFHLQFKTKKLL